MFCSCCKDKVKGRPRHTHVNGVWRAYCPRCYRECRPFPDKTGCYFKGGQNLCLDDMAKAQSAFNEMVKQRRLQNDK